jgi:hypothetical protein
MFKIVFIFFLIFLNSLFAQDCISCHTIEKFDELNHNFSCLECHVKPQDRASYEHDTDIVLHPDSLENVEIFCSKCHKNDIKSVKNSLHVSMKNEINLTRKLWGQKGSDIDLQSLPLPKSHVSEPKDLVDDFLRRKCLKCHIGSQGSGERGMYRGKGCMSCHMEYSEDGKYKGSDISVKEKRPYAKIHTMSKKPPMSACLSCHNKNFVGTDYLGLFPKDYEKSYRAPITKEGKYPKKIYGNSYHHLSQDIHYQKGLTCVDCHKKNEVMGVHAQKSDIKKATCKDCHKQIVKNEAHENYHENVSCSTCHAAWQMSNYELSVFRDDIADYDKWENLMAQEDAYLEKFLKKAIKSKNKPKPYMPDWVSQKMEKGIWYSGWRFKRWEHLLLGNDENGQVKILRPMFQYRISYRDENKTMILNDVHSLEGKKIEAFVPYSPHTITKKAKSCESCHENKLLLNPPKNTNTVLDLFTGQIQHGSPLSKEQIKKLQSKEYKKIRAEMLF